MTSNWLCRTAKTHIFLWQGRSWRAGFIGEYSNEWTYLVDDNGYQQFLLIKFKLCHPAGNQCFVYSLNQYAVQSVKCLLIDLDISLMSKCYLIKVFWEVLTNTCDGVQLFNWFTMKRDISQLQYISWSAGPFVIMQIDICGILDVKNGCWIN